MIYEKHEEYMKRRLREEEEDREAKFVAEYEERAFKDLENRLKIEKELQQMPAKYPQSKKIYESPDGGKTVYEREFGSTERLKIKEEVEDTGSVSFVYTDSGGIEISIDEKTPDYKYNEGALIKEFKAYVDATYSQHYSRDKFQATEFIMDGGHGTGFCIGNVLKYAQRYGKKGNQDDARKDILKVLHYALLQLYVHDLEHNK